MRRQHLSTTAFLALVLARARLAAAADPPSLPPAAREADIEERLGSAIADTALPFTDMDGRRAPLAEHFDGRRPVLLVLAYYRCPTLCGLVLRGLVAGHGAARLPARRGLPRAHGELRSARTPRRRRRGRGQLRAVGPRPGGRADAGDLALPDRRAARGPRARRRCGLPVRVRRADRAVRAPGRRLRAHAATGASPAILYGIEFSARDLRLSLLEASGRGRQAPSLDRVLMTCYRYDPAEPPIRPLRGGLPAARRRPPSWPAVAGTMVALFGWRGAPRRPRRLGARAMNELLRQLLFLPEQRSSVAREIDALHYFVILATMGGATLITLIGGYFLIRYRRRPQDTPRPHPGGVRPAGALPRDGGALRAGLSAVPHVVDHRHAPVRRPAHGAGRRARRLRHGQAVDVEVRLSGGDSAILGALRPRAQAGPAHHDVARRDPQLLRARVPHQAGRHPRPVHHGVVRGDRGRRLPHPVRGVLRHEPLRDARPGDRARPGGLRALARGPPWRAPRRSRSRPGPPRRRTSSPRRSRRCRAAASTPPRSTAASAATPSTERRTSARAGPGSTAPSCRSRPAASASPTRPTSRSRSWIRSPRCTAGSRRSCRPISDEIAPPDVAAIIELMNSLRDVPHRPRRAVETGGSPGAASRRRG